MDRTGVLRCPDFQRLMGKYPVITRTLLQLQLGRYGNHDAPSSQEAFHAVFRRFTRAATQRLCQDYVSNRDARKGIDLTARTTVIRSDALGWLIFGDNDEVELFSSLIQRLPR